ncbi:hypothetical protein B5807_05858 [Epicoccum nigrum]|uniref:Large ribosomal subunit protein mL54 n=1 Tax=Epicoccum nigrum TaxID=105696 RepID=A0A1Y2M335_EPING|nr:hypothetical protein B5807_05858 [Epicoccum nigrum]
MICRTCQRASRALPTRRFLSTTRPAFNAAATPISSAAQPTPRQPNDSPAATSTSAAQPFSAPLTPAPSPALEKSAAKVAEKKAAPLVKSSVPAGTPLKGLNFEKNKQDPVAKADDEYPSWLWTILQRQEDKGDVGAVGDLFCTYSLRTLPFVAEQQSASPIRHSPPPFFFSLSSFFSESRTLTFRYSKVEETAPCRRQAAAQGAGPQPGAAGPQGAAVRADDRPARGRWRARGRRARCGREGGAQQGHARSAAGGDQGGEFPKGYGLDDRLCCERGEEGEGEGDIRAGESWRWAMYIRSHGRGKEVKSASPRMCRVGLHRGIHGGALGESASIASASALALALQHHGTENLSNRPVHLAGQLYTTVSYRIVSSPTPFPPLPSTLSPPQTDATLAKAIKNPTNITRPLKPSVPIPTLLAKMQVPAD